MNAYMIDIIVDKLITDDKCAIKMVHIGVRKHFITSNLLVS